MSQSLTLNISEDVYQYLRRTADQVGRLPEVLAAQWLSLFTRKAEEDTVERFIGSFNTQKDTNAEVRDCDSSAKQQISINENLSRYLLSATTARQSVTSSHQS